MPLTPAGTLIPYCSPPEFLTFIDWRLVGDLCSDTDSRVPLATLQGTGPDYTNADPNLWAALMAASGELEAACLIGNRYTAVDLAALTGASAQYLKKLVSYLAYGILRHRRGIFDDDSQPQVKEARETIDRLEGGGAIFAFDETARAGKPKAEFYEQWEFDRLNLVSRMGRRVFGTRANQYPRS